ncbi:hypothetical protein FUT79_04205 [Treponema phagedenis]|uniref:acyl-CoA thioester hydrolase/BAAT C-terminal domain-containing protein n=1 Tax=Treponema phagedenis TaxID=162 RepID=UPI0011E846BD|nr:acyl-CoA thioester hydrolase/BAAT C-terminal domain-containing protein [Treponema phagedenis]QEJ94484.1 hypothetical protein FUT79_04205 [Treponema phagedenis]
MTTYYIKRFLAVLGLGLLFISCSKFTVEKIEDKNTNSDVQVFSIKGSINGFHYIPKEIKHKGLVVCFGGSEGSAGEWYAADIANEGYEVLAVYYFGKENLPQILSEVPIEFFENVLDYIKKRGSNKKPITLLGASKGAELTALLTRYYPQIDNLILFAPASCVFQGLDYTSSKSSWTRKKEALPFITFTQEVIEKISYEENAIVLRPLYEAAVNEAAEELRKKAEIDLSQFKGKVLIFAGGDDCLWPGDFAAQAFKNQNPDNVDLHIFPKAGHAFGAPPIAGGVKLGGTQEENTKAAIESRRIMFEFLN